MFGDFTWAEIRSIVLIPGIGTPRVETWPFCSATWLQRILYNLPAQGLHARILTFDVLVALNDSFSWQHILLEGGCLLRALADLSKCTTFKDVSRRATSNSPRKKLTVTRLDLGQWSSSVIVLVVLC